MPFVKLYFIALVIFFAVDMLWLGVIAKNFYQKNMGPLLAPEVNWIAAIVFYLMYIAGILYFAVVPGILEDSLRKTLVSGAFFGFITYATYEFTNLATLRDWPVNVLVVDLIWGTVLCLLVSGATFWIARAVGLFS